jgi:hypothetical protein
VWCRTWCRHQAAARARSSQRRACHAVSTRPPNHTTHDLPRCMAVSIRVKSASHSQTKSTSHSRPKAPRMHDQKHLAFTTKSTSHSQTKSTSHSRPIPQLFRALNTTHPQLLSHTTNNELSHTTN